MKELNKVDYFDDVFEKSGIRIVKSENGYRWTIDSVTEFRTPIQALLDAQKAIGELDMNQKSCDTCNHICNPDYWGFASIEMGDAEWSPIIPLR